MHYASDIITLAHYLYAIERQKGEKKLEKRPGSFQGSGRNIYQATDMQTLVGWLGNSNWALS